MFPTAINRATQIDNSHSAQEVQQSRISINDVNTIRLNNGKNQALNVMILHQKPSFAEVSNATVDKLGFSEADGTGVKVVIQIPLVGGGNEHYVLASERFNPDAPEGAAKQVVTTMGGNLKQVKNLDASFENVAKEVAQGKISFLVSGEQIPQNVKSLAVSVTNAITKAEMEPFVCSHSCPEWGMNVLTGTILLPMSKPEFNELNNVANTEFSPFKFIPAQDITRDALATYKMDEQEKPVLVAANINIRHTDFDDLSTSALAQSQGTVFHSLANNLV